MESRCDAFDCIAGLSYEMFVGELVRFDEDAAEKARLAAHVRAVLPEEEHTQRGVGGGGSTPRRRYSSFTRPY